MKKKILCVFIICGIIVPTLTGCFGESDYERDARSGFNKWYSGDFDSMTDGERKAVNDFLEWSNKH